MPRIEEYSAPEGLGIRPTEVGIEATAGAARRVNAAFNEAAGLKAATGHILGSAIESAGAAATTYLDHQQISQGSAAFAGMTAKLTEDWKTRNQHTDPNDPSTGKAWLENTLEPQLQQFKSGFLTDKGQAWAEANVEKLRNHFYTKTTADMSRKAGEAVVINHAQSLNSWSNSVYNDPSLLNDALGLTDQHTKDLVNTSGVEDKPGAITQLTQKNKEMLVKSAALGYIDQHAAMPPWLDPASPEYRKDLSGFVNAQELRQFQRAAEQNQRAAKLQTKQLEDYTKHENVQRVNEAVDQNRNNNTTFDPDTNRYAIKPEFFEEANRIRKLPEGEKQGQAMMEWGQRQQDKRPPPVKDNSAVHTDLLERMITPTDHPTTEAEIRLASAKDDLTPQTTHKLIALNNALTKAPIRDPVFQGATAAAKSLLGTDPVGKENYARFLQDFIPQYLQLPAAERPGALNFQDKNSFINKTIGSYQRDYIQKLIDKKMPPTGTTTTPGGTKPPTVIQNGNTYTLQSDGSYK